MKRIKILMPALLLGVTCGATTPRSLESFNTENPRSWTIVDSGSYGETWIYEAGNPCLGAGLEGEADFTEPLRVDAFCSAATIPFNEGFESGYTDGDILGGCWTQELISNTYWKTNSSITANNRTPRSGDWDIYLPYGSETWMFYPVEVEEGRSYTLTLYAKQSISAGAFISAGYGMSDSSRDMVNEIIPTTEITFGDYQEVSGSFVPAISGVIYVGIKGQVNGGMFPYYMTLDDISITETQSCLNPTGLQVEAVTSTSADISWTPGSSETNWLVKYGEPGFDPAIEGASVAVEDVPAIALIGLTSAHIYNVFVQAQCGGGDGNSGFAGPLTLRTPPVNDALCDAIPLTVDAGCLGSSYSNVGATMETNEPRQGSCIDFPGMQTVWFSFEAPIGGNVTVTTDFEGGTLDDTQVVVYESPIDCNDLSSLGPEVGCDEDGGNIGSGFLSVVTLTDLIEGNTYYIQVNGFLDFFEGTREGTFCIEVLDNSISCPAPTDITFENITTTTVDVSWTPLGREMEWEIKYGPSGFDPETAGMSVNDIDGNPGETINNLDPDTRYDVYVRALCDVNVESDFSEVASFTTLVAPPVNDNVCDAIHLVVDEVCNGNSYTNIGATVERDEPEGSCFFQIPTTTVWFTFEAPDSGNVTVTTNITPSDLENTQMAVYQAPSDCTDLTTMGTEIGCNDDVDFNNNELLSTLSLTGLTVGETYYVQINGNSGDEGDFCIEVLDNSISCPAPTDITFENITTTTVDVSWTPLGREMEWEIKYGPSGFNPETAGMSVNDIDGNPGETINNLDPDTRYDVYVRALCDVNVESDFAGPESFTTMVLSIGSDNFNTFTYYPNPIKDQLILKAKTPIENVVLYNLLGQNIMEFKGNSSQLQLNTSNLQPGVYFMTVSINRMEKTFRLVKE